MERRRGDPNGNTSIHPRLGNKYLRRAGHLPAIIKAKSLLSRSFYSVEEPDHVPVIHTHTHTNSHTHRIVLSAQKSRKAGERTRSAAEGWVGCCFIMSCLGTGSLIRGYLSRDLKELSGGTVPPSGQSHFCTGGQKPQALLGLFMNRSSPKGSCQILGQDEDGRGLSGRLPLSVQMRARFSASFYISGLCSSSTKCTLSCPQRKQILSPVPVWYH